MGDAPCKAGHFISGQATSPCHVSACPNRFSIFPAGAGNFQAKDLPTFYFKGDKSRTRFASAAAFLAMQAIYRTVYCLVTYPKAFWTGGFDAGAATRGSRGRQQWNENKVDAAGLRETGQTGTVRK